MDGVTNCCRSLCFGSWIHCVPVLKGNLALWTSVHTFCCILDRRIHTRQKVWNAAEEIPGKIWRGEKWSTVTV